MMAIRASPNRRSTLAEIYNYIEKHFAYYRTCKTDWQNAIRHNLSMNEYFVRSPRELDEPGRGGYWSLSFAGQHSFVGNDTGRLRQPPVPPAPIMNCYFVPAPVMGGVVAYQYENSGAVGGMYYQMAGPILKAPEDEVANILR
ncbi:unnamed protein product [Hermetia illucens]|uniref:Fork-head domain-containing protein n=2 Tax=Hermetia illucens TaxID=343691 RepID=A0A7R8YPD5_HERIL|nr:unnamed protein product [Hermetia illucens]